MELKIVKFELYPADQEPWGYAVGFEVMTTSGRCFYRDTIVSLNLAQGKQDEEVVAIGYSQLKASIEAEINRLEGKSSLIGKLWTPSE